MHSPSMHSPSSTSLQDPAYSTASGFYTSARYILNWQSSECQMKPSKFLIPGPHVPLEHQPSSLSKKMHTSAIYPQLIENCIGGKYDKYDSLLWDHIT